MCSFGFELLSIHSAHTVVSRFGGSMVGQCHLRSQSPQHGATIGRRETRIDTNGDLKMWVHKYIKSRKAHCTNTLLTHKRAWLPNSPHGSLPAPFANTNTYKHVRCTNECPSCPAARARLEKPEIDCRHAMVHERAQKRAHAKASLCLSRWPVLSAM